MRAIWTASISFGLVNIPIRLYSATGQETKVDLDLLHKTDMSHIRYAKVCKLEGIEVPNDEIVKGYEYADGEYVVIEDEDFQLATPDLANRIEILHFADEEQIDDIYFEKPYYLEPVRGADKAYALLRDAMKKTGKVAIARFMLRSRERIAAIKPEGDALSLIQLRYKSALSDPKELKLPPASEEEGREIELALALIEKLSEPFRPELYKDNYTENLRRVIEEKSAGRLPAVAAEAPPPTRVVDLMAALKKSLEQGKKAA